MKKIFLAIFAVIISASMFAQTAGTLTVTASISGNTHISAIWINNSSGFLRTLYAGSQNNYAYELTNWNTDSKGSVLNATTGASKNAEVLVSTWNGKDINNLNLVPDGTYTVKIETITESMNKVSKLFTTTFTKGTIDLNLTPTSVTPITPVTIKWAHLSLAAVNNVESDKLYSVYPNPAISSIFVSGININQVDICSLNGQRILTSNKQKVDVSSLSKGNYLAVIYAKTGTIVKKIQKL